MPLNAALNLLTETAAPERDYVRMMGTFPFRPTLFLGLGGTGGQAVSKVKQLYAELVAPQRRAGTSAPGRIDPLYAFLAFDTNQQERPGNLTANKEWFHLGVGNMADFYENHAHDQLYEPWVVKGFPEGSIMAGCSGFRNLGRLVLAQNIDIVNEKISNAGTEILTAAAGLETVMTVPVVHVFCSLAGGTGSGMLLDVCFLLRQIFPTARVIGHIAVVDGLPNVPQSIRSTIRVNAFCALKELNAFMSGSDVAPKGRIAYPMGIAGKARTPLDECYLISSSRMDGALSLPRQEHLASFLARLAFMMSAYSFQPGGEARSPDYEGVMVNHTHRLTNAVGGARTCYMVPGFAQVHFPVDETADLLVLDAVRRFLEYQRGGTPRSDGESARAFATQHGLTFPVLRTRIAVDPADKQGRPLAAMRYDDILDDLFDRWDENRDAILGFAARLPAQCLSDYQAKLGPNLAGIQSKVSSSFRETVAKYFQRDGYLARGALDFVRDLKQILQTERQKLESEASLHTDPAYDGIEKGWTDIRSEVENVLTSDNMMDALRDRIHRPKVRGMYTSFLNDADQTVLEKARNQLTGSLLGSLAEDAGAMEASLEAFRLSAEEAIKLIRAREVKLASALFAQRNAQDPSALNIRSFNAMDEEWRRTYIENSGLSAATMLGTLVAGGWRPIEMVELKPAPGITVAQSVANAVIERAAPFFDEVRRWTPAQVLQKTEQVCRVRPEQILAKVYFTLQQAQMEIGAMRTRLNTPVDKLIFFGGITEEIRDRLAVSEEFAGVDFNLADNQESNRINFISVSLPVALAGCDLVVNRLAPDYEDWLATRQREGKTRDYEIAKHHCFPRSLQWPDPTRYSTQHDSARQAFARALAVSEMLQVSEDDLKRMTECAKTPKEQRYSLFQVGASQFWLWPFFVPNDPTSAIIGKPQNLGANVIEACERFTQSAELQAEAQQWVNWFQANWSGVFRAPEAIDARARAIGSFNQRKGRVRDPHLTEMWDEIVEIVQDWDFGA
jgi:hypothetical protein